MFTSLWLILHSALFLLSKANLVNAGFFYFRFNVRMTLLQTNSSRNLSKPSLSSIEISALFIEKKLFKYLLKELYKFIYFNLNLK